MPIRMLRDWTDSEVVDALDASSEVLFVRLIMKADDYGRFTANPKLVRSLCFPLKAGIRETDIARQLAACEKAGLIVLYQVADKPLLEIVNFGQRLRSSKAKYPARIDDPATATTGELPRVAASCRELPQLPATSGPNGIESETDIETETEAQSEVEQMRRVLDAMAERLTMPSGESKDFRDWYSIYPNPCKQGKAWQSYQNAILAIMRDALADSKIVSERDAVAILLDGVRRYAESPAGRTPPADGSRDFRPEPHGWLDGKCWLDPIAKLQSGGNVPNKKVAPTVNSGSTGSLNDLITRTRRVVEETST